MSSDNHTTNAAVASLSPPGRWVEGLSAESPLLDALETIVQQRWQGVLHYLPRVMETPDDVERVHKLRVSTRRLSAVLDVLAEEFPAASRKKLSRLSGRIRRRCAKTRDLDVRRSFLQSLLPHASVEDAAVIELLSAQAERRRRKAQKKLTRRLPKLERRIARAGESLLEQIERLRRGGVHGHRTFGGTGAQTLLDELAGLWSYSEDELGSDQVLHQLRIACKRLRYVVEVFAPVLPEGFRDDFYPQLEHIQDLLGEIHDAAEASDELRRQRKKWKRARDTAKWAHSGLSTFRWPELRSGLDAVLLALAQQADQARTEFLELWPGFAGESFRRPVEDALLTFLAGSPPEHADEDDGEVEGTPPASPAARASSAMPPSDGRDGDPAEAGGDA